MTALLMLCEQGNATFERLCYLGEADLQSLEINGDTGDISVVDTDISDRNQTRQLFETQEDSFVPAIQLANPISKKSFRRALEEGNESKNHTQIIYARECTCAELTSRGAFCPLDKDTCGLSSEDAIYCFTESTRIIMLRNAWPIVVMWYAILFLLLFCTARGRTARQYLYIFCCHRDFNHELAEQILHPSRTQRRRPFPFMEDPSDTMAMEDPPIEEEELHRPRQLALKTKRFVAPTDNVDEEQPNCTICFATLEDGDRVGALPCQHAFHADCLKEWIQRRNVCPLCQMPNVAVPHHDEEAQVHVQQQPERPVRSTIFRSLEVTQETDGERHRPFSGQVILRRIRR